VLVEGERGTDRRDGAPAAGRAGRGGGNGRGGGGHGDGSDDDDAAADDDDADRAAAAAAAAAPDRPRDYASWRAEVRVQFRASEPLSVLTAFRQSGGERSVSTILYLVALQDVTVTPFRVVDEINQGMDPVNERKVFRLLVEASTRPRTPQCFLLTPKLLPGLPFGPDVTVLSIFNGVHVAAGAAAGLTRARLYGARYNKATGLRAAQEAARARDARRAKLLAEGAAEAEAAMGEEEDEATMDADGGAAAAAVPAAAGRRSGRGGDR
jgi:hypothetical protein